MASSGASGPLPPPEPGPPASVRAQLLATEHWSLLASRGMIRGEQLTRINIFLTLVSASLLGLAFVAQVTGFGPGFSTIAIVLLTIVLMVGTLTVIRVFNGGFEDLAYILAMNRLRAAYVDLDPGIERYFLTSTHDDRAGAQATYLHLGGPNRTQLLGSSMVLVVVVAAALAGVLAAIIGYASALPGVLAYGIGAAVMLVYIGVAVSIGRRRYFRVFREFTPHSPSPDA